MADRSSNVLTHLADRRHAVRLFGAASTALLAALGLGGVTGEARGQGGPDKGKRQSDNKQRTGHTRHKDDTNAPRDRGDEPAEPVGDTVAESRSAQNDAVTAQRKRRRSTKVVGDLSGPLPATNGALVLSRAFCPGGDGKLLSGGYGISGTPAQLANVIVDRAAPDDGVGSFVAVLRCPSGSACTAGATIQAIAVCKG